jgi:chorismate dehydratase
MERETMKLGYINYLNCYPLYYHMMKKSPIPGVEIVPAYPSELNEMMRNRELDMSPISSAAYADIQGDVMILPDFCLASVGYVRSVILISRVPIEDLDKRRIGLSNASQTSVVLLRSLLRKYYGIEPIYQPTRPSPTLESLDAALVIGNEAMIHSREAIPYVYDLGDLWFRKTGFPVVFALFVARKAAVESEPDAVDAVIRSYHASLSCLNTDERETFLQSAKSEYPNIAYDIPTYFRLIKYDLTETLKQALRFYFALAGEELGLLKTVGELEFMG